MRYLTKAGSITRNSLTSKKPVLCTQKKSQHILLLIYTSFYAYAIETLKCYIYDQLWITRTKSYRWTSLATWSDHKLCEHCRRDHPYQLGRREKITHLPWEYTTFSAFHECHQLDLQFHFTNTLTVSSK